MRDVFLLVAKRLLLLAMVVYLPVFWGVSAFARLLRETHEALEVELLLSQARRKVSAEMKRRARR